MSMSKTIFRELLDKEASPALGCTEPMMFALAGAITRKHAPGKVLRVDMVGCGLMVTGVQAVGIPNTGKSSFINRMAGNSKAKVADKAGVTRQKQWFAVGKGIELLDTPGVLWPKFDDSEVGDKLAFTGAVKDEVTDLETLSCRLLETLAKTRPKAICDRYKLDSVDNLQGWEMLELIGKKRGFLIKGGEIDYERTAVMLCDEFRGGKLGKISLELP